jgi:hypothetical protein
MVIDLSQGLESTKTVALICGGIWTVWTFQKLQKARTAEINYNLKVLDQKDKQVHLLRQQPQLSIGLTIAELCSPPEGLLSITALLKNEGDQNFDISFDGPALTVGRIEFENGDQNLKELSRVQPWPFIDGNDTPEPLEPRRFRVGQNRQLSFVVPFRKPGAYFIQFCVTYVKVAFDGETKPREGTAIRALEQAIYFTRVSEPQEGKNEFLGLG